MSKVHFIDTSVLVELLNVPGKNERYEEVKAEYEQLAKHGDIFVLPIAVLIEAGNHIAHISDGNMRYQIADKFSAIVWKAAKSEDHWNVMPEIPIEVLEKILKQFPKQAAAETGFGDISIVEQFNDYWETLQPIGEMRIWSLDAHLLGYSRTGGLARRKNR